MAEIIFSFVSVLLDFFCFLFVHSWKKLVGFSKAVVSFDQTTLVLRGTKSLCHQNRWWAMEFSTEKVSFYVETKCF